jgi:hypothetical protein
MHDLPGAIFGSKGHRNPQIAWGDILSSANLCVGPLYPTNAGKLRCDVLRYSLEAIDLAISIIRCASLLGLSDLLPPAHGRPKGVSKGYVFSMGEKVLHRLGVAFHELIPRELKLFEYLVKIIYASHFAITSTVGTSYFPSIPHEHTTLITHLPVRRVLGNSATQEASRGC